MRQTWDRLGYFRSIANRLEEKPELFAKAVAIADRWLANGIEPRNRVQAWRDLMARANTDEAARREACDLLREDSEDAEFLREFAPVPGILSKTESRVFSRECAYSH